MASHSKHCIQQQYPPNPPIPSKTQNTTEIFPTQDTDPHPHHQPPDIKITNWATFTYTSPQIRKITNLFKDTNVRTAYKCTNTISHLSKPTNKETLLPSPYDRSGIYKLTCMTCNKAYVGQTSRNLTQRYKEHARYIKNNNQQSAYALHILNNKHEYGPMEKTMTLLKPVKTPPC